VPYKNPASGKVSHEKAGSKGHRIENNSPAAQPPIINSRSEFI
jgi:hypothetical protein